MKESAKLGVGRSHPEVSRGLVHVRFDYPAKERPDGLIIADDNLVEHVGAGLVEAGLAVGRDLDVVAHCNWPWPVASVLPICRLGFHAGDLLQIAIDVIDATRAGRSVEPVTLIPPLFETELQASGTGPQSAMT